MSLEVLLGASLPVFIGLTVVLFGFAAFMTGQAVAGTWRPEWQIYPYCALLAAADRFLVFALFEGRLLSLWGYVLHALVLTLIAFFAYRVTRAQKMVSQYPWLYERNGLFGWRPRNAG